MAGRVGTAAGLFVACAVAVSTLMPSRPEAATFRGTVVDADTGEPLEGAVIVAIWMRHAEVPVMHSVAKPYKAVERLADAQGRFTADGSAGLFAFAFHSRQVMVVKPGYRRLTIGTYERWAPLFGEPIVRLAKIKTREEFRQHLVEGLDVLFICNDPEPSVLCVPRLWVPHLARINEIQTRLSETAPGVNSADAKSWTPLHYAAHGGHAEKLETLLAAGAGVNAQSERGWTPLTLAVMRRHTATARRLLAAGADVNLKNGAGDPPIIIASQFELVQIAMAGPRVHVVDASPGREPTQATVAPPTRAAQTIRNREPALVEVLLDAGADPNSRDRDRLTPFMWAAAQGRLDLVQLLLSRGADPDAKASYGITAWQLAVGDDVIRAFRAARPKP